MTQVISNQEQTTNFNYDIVIAGGGLAGLSMAQALSCLSKKSHGRSLSIAIIEPNIHKNKNYNVDHDPRHIALTYGSKLIYESLDLWDTLSACSVPMKKIHVSERGGIGISHLSAQDYQVPALGYVIANQHLLSALEKKVTALSNVTLFQSATVKSVDMSEDKKRLIITQQNKTFSVWADLVIVAEGGRSSLMQQLGFKADEKDYGHTAILATITHDKPHNDVAYERFTGEGSIAMLPVYGNSHHKSAVVWTMPHTMAKKRLQLADNDFLKELQTMFGYRCGCFCAVGKRLSFPLKLKVVAEPARQGAVLLGNSAHSLHPVAGQGYNLTLRDVMTLASLLATTNTDQSLGDLALLQRYLSQQKRDQCDTILFSDYLIKMFTSSNPLIRFGRNTSLFLFDNCPPAKRWFSYLTMGMGGYGR